jgi:hypothetical protein
MLAEMLAIAAAEKTSLRNDMRLSLVQEPRSPDPAAQKMPFEATNAKRFDGQNRTLPSRQIATV